MRTKQINLAVILLALSMLSLLIVQSFQLYSKYYQKKKELSSEIIAFQNQIAYKHEKAEDYRRYMQIINQDFSLQYQDILKSEFQSLTSSNASVSVSDTLILSNGKKEKYLVIRGQAYDSLTGLTTEQKVLAKNYQEIKDVFSSGSGMIPGRDSSSLSLQLNQQAVQQIFKKAKYINDMMLEAFKDNVLKSPQERIDAIFLDSIISFEIKKERLPKTFTFCIFDANNNPVPFQEASNKYKETKTNKTFEKVKLFPSNPINQSLYLQLNFPKQNQFLLNEMKGAIIVSVLVVCIVLAALVFMIKTIVEQKKLSELKAGLVSNMTHEFKTPISTIALACEALKDPDVVGVEKAAQIEPYLNMIHQENKRLENLVENILQNSLLDRKDQIWEGGTISIIPLCEKIVSNAKFRVVAEKYNIAFTYNDSAIQIQAKESHIRSVVANLLDNAIKYSPEPAEIKLDIKQNREDIVLTFSDKGIGINKEHLPKIFDNLYRVPTGNIHDVKGFGLGLNYVKKVCDGYGWRLDVKSTFGKGTTFEIKINR
ncbi:MAG: HAMP domain-containing sensor histidine kinase [Crocinitomicaceae bacterium]|jgi:two-component system phosphate regulon sensor histidine kinase PhoR|nr:HAMP domain-containing sensor histidine kinase [Crocinitomicaceae bacterium]MDG2504715.1 HAMP domain-containing sensor histidine kinase [Crocinitomicaceae bacterium]